MPTFPALLHLLPEAPGQRILVPFRNATEFDEALRSPDDPPGWAVGCRLIDAKRRIYTLAYAAPAYDLRPATETLDDSTLRQLMSRNTSALGRDPAPFDARTRGLAGTLLFEAAVHQVTQLPALRPSFRAFGLLIIVLLILAALVVPAVLLLRVLP